ncbi:MAG: hypothetical protein ACKN9U_01660 [Pirellulaceae bacterium]
MLNLPMALLFTAMTFLSWGVYGILLHEGQDRLGHSSLRSFIGVGIAYFLIAVLGAAILLSTRKEKGVWSLSGILLSLFAGSVGALGALGVLLALTFKGAPIFVMPLVFGLAPVVNTLVTSWMGKTYRQISPKFITGLVLVALGAVGVLLSKPAPAKAATSDVAAAVATDGASTSSVPVAKPASANTSWKVLASILMGALCWGAYGPVLHLGQQKMGGSRLRPFFCVGVAYFAIAVAAPLAILAANPDEGYWSFSGMLWSIAAGAAGAIGALGIILAFTFGGKPIFVMPLVFGFAPVVNTLVSMTLANSFGKVSPMFFVSLLTGIAGAVTVLLFAPKGKGHGPAKEEPQGQADAAAKEPESGAGMPIASAPDNPHNV